MCSKSRKRISGIAGAISIFACMTGIVAAQTSQQPKATPNAAAPKPTPVPAQPTWQVSCTNSPSGMNCRAIQMLFITKTGQRVMTIAVHLLPDSDVPEMLLALPLGGYLPAGAVLRFGKEQAKTVPIESCDRSGCLAKYTVTQADLASLLKGTDLTISMQDVQKRPIAYTVPAAGFAEAWAKIK
jgi:invasion protein IalB